MIFESALILKGADGHILQQPKESRQEFIMSSRKGEDFKLYSVLLNIKNTKEKGVILRFVFVLDY